MWPYKKVTRAEFEKKKDFVEAVLKRLGAKETDFGHPIQNASIFGNIEEKIIANRIVFEYKDCYYRVSEVLFVEKPFIVIEFADKIDDVINNCMEDIDPFPYDLGDSCVIEEVKKQINS